MLNSNHAQKKTTLQQQNVQAPIGNWVGNFDTNCHNSHTVVIFKARHFKTYH